MCILMGDTCTAETNSIVKHLYSNNKNIEKSLTSTRSLRGLSTDNLRGQVFGRLWVGYVSYLLSHTCLL